MKPSPNPKISLSLRTLKPLAAYCCAGLVLYFNSPGYAALNLWTGARTVQGGVTIVGGILGGDANWSSEFDDGGPSNWAEPVPPPFEPPPHTVPANDGTADIQFNGTVGLNPVVDRNWDIHSMLFGPAATNTFQIFGAGHTLTIRAGVTNNSPIQQTLGNPFSTLPLALGASQTWLANTASLYVDLGNGAQVGLGANNLTIAGAQDTTILPKLTGSGTLTKTGAGTLFLGGSSAFNSLFTGGVIVSGGILQIDGAGTIRSSTGVSLRTGGTLLLHRPFSIGSFTVPIIFDGGKLSAVVPVPPNDPALNVSDRIGTFVISNNASSIDLDPANANQVALTFTAGSRPGNGNVTINNWQGTNDGPLAVGGTDDSIFVTAAPSASFLNGITFAGFPAGAARLATGEIVPAGPSRIWDGGGSDDNWSTGGNWVGDVSPLTNGTALVSFGGTTRLTPQVDAPWDVLGVNMLAGAGAFTMGGSALTIRSHGLTNNSVNLQTFANSIIAAAPQTWNANLGPLSFTGASDNGGYSPAIEGTFGVRIGPGGGLSGSGGLIKNGANKLTISAPITFTGPIILNSGIIEADVANVGGGQPFVFNGGTLSGNNLSQTFGSVTLSNNSIINLVAGAPGAVLTFSGGSYAGGKLTINNWSGTAGNTGTDDKIIMTSNPSANLLENINFAGFNPGAARLPSGELVPYPTNSIWAGPPAPASLNDNWSNPANWVGGNVPVSFGVARLIFRGLALTRREPLTDAPWDVRSITFDNGALASFTLHGSQITLRDGGITNSSSFSHTLSNSIVLGAAQTWQAVDGDLTFAGLNNSGVFPLTIDTAIGRTVTLAAGSGLSGSGSLTKTGSGTLIVNSALTFTGPLVLNNGTVQTPSDNVLSGRNVTFGGGTFSALNRTQAFGSFTLTNNSTINLDAGGAAARLSFTSSTRSGGTLTINGWTGLSGRSGTGDQIFMTAVPGPGVLENINFSGGYGPGAVRLASGEIVPFPDAIAWDGNNVNGPPANDNWSTDSNWIGGLAPVNYGAARVYFDGSIHTNAVVDVSWDVQGIVFNSLAGTFMNSGSQLKIRVDGIANNSSSPQTFANSILLGSTQTWNAANGPLAFSGTIANGGFALTLNGTRNINFQPGSGLSGTGGLIKKGAGTNIINVPLTFTGPVALNGGAIETLVDNALSGRPVTFGGGALNAKSTAQLFGALTLTNDSTINLDIGGNAGTLTFSSASRTAGTLTIIGWTGFAGTQGTDDRIFITAKPTDAFLAAINFSGFPPGAIRLPSGEIVPGLAAVWVGLGNNDSWETATNWLGNKVPKNTAVGGVKFNLIFDGTNRLTPVVPSSGLAWQVAGLLYTNTVDIPPTTVSLTNPLGGYIFYTNIVNYPGGFTNSGQPFSIGTNGIVNNRNSGTAWIVLSNNLVLLDPQTWKAAAGILALTGSNFNNGHTLTIDGLSNTVFGVPAGIITPASGALTGAGGLVKKGKGTLVVNVPLTFTGTITNSLGAIATAANNSLSQNMVMNGGTLSLLSRSNTLGNLTLAGDSKVVLDPPGGVNVGAGTLRFASGTYVSGTLIISNWTGIAGTSGLDDRIFMTSDPGPQFLAAIRFDGYSAGAIRLNTGELVPSTAYTWNGQGASDNWTVPQNWVGSMAPLPLGTATLIFDGFTRLTPITDVNYDVLNIIYAANAGEFVNSGAPITLESNGVAIVNLGSRLQSLSNNLVLGTAQTWSALGGPLAFFGTNSNGGNALTIDGGAAVGFGPGGGLSGAGGLMKNGTGALTVSAPMTFTGAISNNSGTIAAAVNGVFNNSQSLTLNGGTLAGLSTIQTFTGLTLVTNSTIELDPGNTNKGVLTFASASLLGGSLVINGWSGVGGQSGTDDRIVVTAAPLQAFLNAVHFTGFPPGAEYLPLSHEIVPPTPVPPPPASLGSITRPSPTEFQFSIGGISGHNYTVQSSMDLTNWVDIASGQAASDPFTFTDPDATNTIGFYRVFVSP